MQILNNINQQQFGATKIGTVKIKHLQNGEWVDKTANLIKFNQKRDVEVLRDIDDLWHGKNCSREIARDAAILKGRVNTFGITLQNNNFKTADPEKIIGIASTDEITLFTPDVVIFRQGTIPEFAHENNDRKVKHIGQALVEGLKKYAYRKTELLPNVDPLCASHETMAQQFYNRIG